MEVGLNRQIRQHATRSADWRHVGKAKRDYAILDAVASRLFQSSLPDLVIGYDDTGRRRKSGEYFYEGDGLSLVGHIELRRDLSVMETVISLLHNCVHAESETYGSKKTWYHSKAFQERMKGFGVSCRPNGDVESLDVSAFAGTLNTLGLGTLVPELEAFEPVEAPGAASEPEPVPAGAVTQSEPSTAEPETVEIAPEPVGSPGDHISLTAKGALEAMGLSGGKSPYMPDGVGQSPMPTPKGAMPWQKKPEPAKAGPKKPPDVAVKPSAVAMPTAKAPAKTKMAKWTCGCTIVRCATELEAGCFACGKEFVKDG